MMPHPRTASGRRCWRRASDAASASPQGLGGRDAVCPRAGGDRVCAQRAAGRGSVLRVGAGGLARPDDGAALRDRSPGHRLRQDLPGRAEGPPGSDGRRLGRLALDDAGGAARLPGEPAAADAAQGADSGVAARPGVAAGDSRAVGRAAGVSQQRQADAGARAGGDDRGGHAGDLRARHHAWRLPGGRSEISRPPDRSAARSAPWCRPWSSSGSARARASCSSVSTSWATCSPRPTPIRIARRRTAQIPDAEAAGAHLPGSRTNQRRAAPAAHSRGQPRGAASLRGARAPGRAHLHRLHLRCAARPHGAARSVRGRHSAGRVPAAAARPRAGTADRPDPSGGPRSGLLPQERGHSRRAVSVGGAGTRGCRRRSGDPPLQLPVGAERRGDADEPLDRSGRAPLGALPGAGAALRFGRALAAVGPVQSRRRRLLRADRSRSGQ